MSPPTQVFNPHYAEEQEAMPRKRMTPTVAERIAANQAYVCAKCGARLMDGRSKAWLKPVQIDHVVPLELGGANDDTNLEALCATPCHAIKTVEDVKRIAKARRLRRAADPETRKITKRPLKSQGFYKGPKRRKLSGEVVDR